MKSLPKSYVWSHRVFWGLFVLLSLCFVVTDWDLRIHEAIYEAGGEHWELGKAPFWKFLYHVGPYFSVILTLVSLVVWIAGVGRDRLARWRKLAIFWFCSMLVGPGIVTNLILKDHWGRPRPRMLEQFGGDYMFERLLHIDLSSIGKSFPCGHATIGFVFFSVAVLFWRAGRKGAPWMAVAAFVFGGLIGVARMLQGGHFASDVIWAAAVCLAVAELLHRWLRMDEGWWFEGAVNPKRTWVGVFAAPAVVGMVCLSLLATPRKGESSAKLHSVAPRELRWNVDALLEAGVAVEYDTGPAEWALVYQGHGWPKSKVELDVEMKSDGAFVDVILAPRFKGVFIEKTVKVVITHP